MLPVHLTFVAFRFGCGRVLTTRGYGGGADNGQDRQYDITPDGRFLINTVLDDAYSPITLIQNWRSPVK
jgi:hypothetical protein